MRHRHVLVVAYFFPPLGGGGVQRSLKFVRYLPDLGWRPTVLTVEKSGYWITDDSLLAEVPGDVPVLRAPTIDGPALLARLRGRGQARAAGPVARETSSVASGARPTARRAARTSRLRAISGWLLVPDAYRPWKPFALRAARRWLRERPVDVIFTTSSPDSAHLIGLDLARETGLPWVADFRDPWTRRISFSPPTPVHRRWHEALERRVIDEARAVVVTADETRADFLDRYPGLGPESVSVIPNGYDRDDFDRLEEPPGETFTLLHLGQLTAGRTVAPMVPVLESFFRATPAARSVTRIRCVGPRETENDAIVRRAGLEDVIRFESAMPHREAVRELGRSHVLLVLESWNERAGLIAQGKLYECLHAGRPVLALAPPGAAHRIVRETGGGLAVGAGEEDAAADFLRDAHEAWRAGRLLPGADPASLERYERRSLTRDLAALFDRLI